MLCMARSRALASKPSNPLSSRSSTPAQEPSPASGLGGPAPSGCQLPESSVANGPRLVKPARLACSTQGASGGSCRHQGGLISSQQTRPRPRGWPVAPTVRPPCSSGSSSKVGWPLWTIARACLGSGQGSRPLWLGWAGVQGAAVQADLWRERLALYLCCWLPADKATCRAQASPEQAGRQIQCRGCVQS